MLINTGDHLKIKDKAESQPVSVDRTLQLSVSVSAERTNQPHIAALCFFLTGISNSSLAQHISPAAAIYFIFLTILGISQMTGSIMKLKFPHVHICEEHSLDLKTMYRLLLVI